MNKKIAAIEMALGEGNQPLVALHSNELFADLEPPDQVALLLGASQIAMMAARDIAEQNEEEYGEEIDEVIETLSLTPHQTRLDG